MPAQLTTRTQVNGYRFLLKRYDHALIRRDVRMLHDPMRTQFRSLLIGAVLGLLGVAGAVILAFLKPQGAMGDAKIIMTKESGGIYAVINGTMHPALNLASARLATGSNENPTSVATSKLGDKKRGPTIGIPGAPEALPGSGSPDSIWTICDSADANGVTTTVIAGRISADGGRATPVGPDTAMLAQNEGKTFLLYAGQRAELDPNDSVVTQALHIQGDQARPVSTGLLNATVPVPPLTPPKIDKLGAPGPGRLAQVPVGAVIRVHGVDTDEVDVVLADGVQQISPFTADMIRTANSEGMSQIRDVPPDSLVGVPRVMRLPVDAFPQRTPKILTTEQASVGCTAWSGEQNGKKGVLALLAGQQLPLRSGSEPVKLASADGSGPRVDAVYIPPGTGEYVQATGIEPGSARKGPLFYVGDNGIRYGIPDPATSKVLGLPATPKPAPWPIIGQLVAGPTLDAADALQSRDTVASPTGS